MSTIVPYARAWKSDRTFTPSNSVYLDSIFGDDLRGDGSKDFPWKSLNRALLGANSLNKTFVIARGVFVEEVINGYNKTLIADATGECIIDQKFQYCVNGSNLKLGDPSYNQHAVVIMNVPTSSIQSFLPYKFIAVNADYFNLPSYNPVWRYIVLHQRIGATSQINIFGGSISNSVFVNLLNTLRPSSATNATSQKTVYQNCKIFVDSPSTVSFAFIKCVFDVKCTFWRRNIDDTADERIDNDMMDAAQKQAALTNYLNNATTHTKYKKIAFTDCYIVDAQPTNASSTEAILNTFDFSLAWGPKETHPACHIDNGKHIGALPPAMALSFKYTADLTESPLEIEIKPDDKITIIDGYPIPDIDFEGAELVSKVIPIPVGSVFNGFNVPNICGDNIITSSIEPDLSASNEIVLDNDGTALVSGRKYLVKTTPDSSANYLGTNYYNGDVIHATDNSVCTRNGSGTCKIYALPVPSLFQQVLFKVCESANAPADFLTNDVAYPWMLAHPMSMGDAVRTGENGLRCLRVGDTNTGQIDIGSDGKHLTNGHPEYYNNTNKTRPKFYVRASNVILKIKLVKYK